MKYHVVQKCPKYPCVAPDRIPIYEINGGVNSNKRCRPYVLNAQQWPNRIWANRTVVDCPFVSRLIIDLGLYFSLTAAVAGSSTNRVRADTA